MDNTKMLQNAEDAFRNFGKPINEDPFKAWEQEQTEKKGCDYGSSSCEDDTSKAICHGCGEYEDECVCDCEDEHDDDTESSNVVPVAYKAEAQELINEANSIKDELRTVLAAIRDVTSNLKEKLLVYAAKTDKLNDKVAEIEDVGYIGYLDVDETAELLTSEWDHDTDNDSCIAEVFKSIDNDLDNYIGNLEEFMEENTFGDIKSEFSMFEDHKSPGAEQAQPEQKKSEFDMFQTNAPSPSTPFYAGSTVTTEAISSSPWSQFQTPAEVKVEEPQKPVDPFEEFAKKNGFGFSS